MTQRPYPIPDKAGPCANPEPDALMQNLAAALAAAGLDQSLKESHPYLFSSSSVFVRAEDLERMQATIAAVESVIAAPTFQAAVLGSSNPAARHDPHTFGAAIGYDFHIGPDGPRLIEINTNAGGMLLALAILRANLACCPPLLAQVPGNIDPDQIESLFAEMLVQEWQAVHSDRPPQTLAIVDDAPREQFLYPEFVLYQALFRRQRIEAMIADPSAFTRRDQQLWAGDRPVDVIYNRLTDFSLGEPAHAMLRESYLADEAVITPHPRAHALYADKGNLALFTDPERLRTLDIDDATITTLQSGIASTRRVQRETADRLWEQRKRLFFKPLSGYGSKAVYRGDKLTRRVWEEILAADYVAQDLVPPAEQAVSHDAEDRTLKYDIRNFTYRGKIQMLSARLYQGQTTNLRTPGGGFAPVFRVNEAHEA